MNRAKIAPADRFVAAVFIAGVAAFAATIAFDRVEDPIGLAAIVALCVATEYFAVKLYFDGSVSVAFVGLVVAVVLFGPAGGAITATACALAGPPAERSLKKLAFNVGQLNIASVSATLLLAVPWASNILDATPWLLAGGAVAGLTLFAITSVLVATVMSLSSGRGFAETHRENFAWLLPHHAALGAFAGGLALAYVELGVWGIAVFAAPLLLTRYTMKQFVDRTRENVLRLERSNEQLQSAYVEIKDMSHELQDAYTGTLESLVAALDMRDQETRGHSSRVAAHSYELAQLLGVSDPEELAMLYRGALMHDVGKIGVPDAILRKPGP
ncbi:MAG: HD domain-containing protein, partial [Dehalococcoidia bacterium]